MVCIGQYVCSCMPSAPSGHDPGVYLYDNKTIGIGRIDREQIRSRINNNDCRTFRPRRPLSTAYRTGPSWPKRPAIIVIDSATYLLTINSPNINKVAMSLYDIKTIGVGILCRILPLSCL